MRERWNLNTPRVNKRTVQLICALIILVISNVTTGLIIGGLSSQLDSARNELQECQQKAMAAKTRYDDGVRLFQAYKLRDTERLESYKQEISRLLAAIDAYKPVEVTAYTLRTPMASGPSPWHGVIAVSRDLYEKGWTFGKEVHIPRYGVFKITDLMGPQWKNKLDIWVADKHQARQIGNVKAVARLM